MKTRVALFAVVTVCALASMANAVPVTINTGNYAGQWDMDLDGNFRTGSANLDLAPGWHTFRPGTVGQVIFTVSASGDVTLDADYDGVSATGGPGVLNVLTRPVTVDPGAFQGFWAISRVRVDAPGADTIQLVPGNHVNYGGNTGIEYIVSAGVQSSWVYVSLAGNGNLSVRDGGATTGAGTASMMYDDNGTLRFRNTTVFVDDTTDSATPWAISRVTPYNGTIGDASVILLPGAEYGFHGPFGQRYFRLADPCTFTPATQNVGTTVFAFSCGPADGDADGVPDNVDNAPANYNPDQSDVDNDGVGDVADPCPSDATNTCDPNGSASGSIGADGGTVTTADGNVAITIPPGALPGETSISVTDTGSTYELATNLGQALAAFGIEITPEGTVFLVPITLVFAWDDADDDGIVDGTNLREDNLQITKNNVAITDRCKVFPGCDVTLNTFTFTVSSLSFFTLAGPLDTDNDGIADDFGGMHDVCPTEDATGFDVDEDGCIDWFNGLADLVDKLVIEGVISAEMQSSLLAKTQNAQSSYERDKVCVAVSQLEALKNQVNAQRGNKISSEAADEVVAYADSIIAVLKARLPSGTAC